MYSNKNKQTHKAQLNERNWTSPVPLATFCNTQLEWSLKQGIAHRGQDSENFSKGD